MKRRFRAVFIKVPAIVACMAVLSLATSIQLLACGLISLQNKCYFEQMFHLGTSTYRMSRGNRK